MPKKFELLVESTNVFHISIWGALEEYEDYELPFDGMGSRDSVKLYVSTSGGSCAVGFHLCNKIASLPCKVDVIVPYPTYSMGALIALSGDSLELRPGAFLMFHDYSTDATGKGNEILQETEAYKETFNHLFKSISFPFLTKKECENVLNGQDFYVKWNSPDLKDRIRRHFK